MPAPAMLTNTIPASVRFSCDLRLGATMQRQYCARITHEQFMPFKAQNCPIGQSVYPP